MPYKIEKNVPLSHRTSSNKYPLKELKVGDSFFVPVEDLGLSGRNGIYVAATRLRIKITIRQQPDRSLRVWRIK